MRRNKSIDAINQFLLNKIRDEWNESIDEEKEAYDVSNIIFLLKENGAWVHYDGTRYEIGNRITNVIQLASWLMDDIQLDDEERMDIFKIWLDNIHELVDEIYNKINKHE